ncbi:TetR/AcrR family transcriptional regulator [Paenibacillus paridis]|uniref:TetR/AcrR family transcriptional regulator n=1 Tax=Paenibacillus paridis TaxID=2583376 RepID=UPI00111F5583|nr:TetR/AcrR family transcriptional regulator [Paenibacillus paridis]
MTVSHKKIDRRIIRSKEALKHAFMQLMSQKRFATISITEIVELANYNRGTFYTHYESKEALLDEIMSELIEDLLRSFRAPYEKTDVIRINELPAASIMLFDHIYEHASIYTILLKSDVLSLVRDKMFEALKNIVTEELEHTVSDINQELMTIYSMSALLGLVFYWIENGFVYSPSYMQEQLVKMLQWRPTSAKTIKKHP